MATTCKAIQTLEVNLETKPGALAKIYSAFKEANVNVIASWGYEMGPDEARAILYPTDLAKAKSVLTELGLSLTVRKACYAECEDKVGTYADLLNKIAVAGVNITATDAFGVNGRCATVFFCDTKDYSALCRALGC